MEKYNYIIYRAKNELTGEAYVGASRKSMRQRQIDHVERAKRGELGSLHSAIATYGPEAFSWKTVDTASSVDELAKKEKEYIVKYDSLNNGYNSDSGGGIQKTVYQYSLKDGSLVNTYSSLQHAANAVNASKTCVGNVCIGQNKSCKGYYWTYSPPVPFIWKDKRKKSVVQLDANGRVVARYSSVAEAGRITGISKSNIAKYCRGERKPPRDGYIWKYV